MSVLKERCSLCGSDKTEPYLNDSRILKCRECGIVFLSQLVRIKNLDKYYSEGDFWHDSLTNPEEIEMSMKNSRKILKILGNYISNFENKKLLDIGARDGFFVKEALRAGYNAKGIDPNQKIAERAQERGLPIFESSIEDWKGEPSDVVTIFHVLEHLKDPQAVIDRIRGLLVSGGLLVLEVPDIESFLAINHGISWRFISLEHLFYFSLGTLTNMLKKAGFSILHSERRNFEIRYVSTKEIMQYFQPSVINRDRFKMKVSSPKSSVELSKKMLLMHNFLRKSMIKNIAGKIVEMLGRGDHLFVIAKLN